MYSPNSSQASSSVEWSLDKSLRPVVVRQLLDAQQAHTSARFKIDGQEVIIVAMVAQLSGDRPIKLVLEDGSRGRITANQWITDGDSAKFRKTIDPRIRELTYVRVIGTLSSYMGYNFLNILSSKHVDDIYEVYYHLLDAMATTLMFECGPPPPGVVQAISREVRNRNENPSDDNESNDPVARISEAFPKSVTIRKSDPQSSNPTSPPPPTHTVAPEVADSDDSDDRTKDPKWKGKGRDYGPCGELPVLDEWCKRGSISHPPTGSPRDGPSTPTPRTTNHGGFPSVPPTPESPSKSKRDPLSNLSALQRGLYLRVCEADRPSSLYMRLIDSSPNDFKGVDLRVMTKQYSNVDEVSAFEDAIDFLIDQGYLIVQDDYFVRVKGL